MTELPSCFRPLPAKKHLTFEIQSYPEGFFIMRKTTVTLCCLFALVLQNVTLAAANRQAWAHTTPSVPRDHGGKIESKYDGFNHETVVSLKKMRVTCGGPTKQSCVSFAVSLHCPGVQLDYVRYAKLQLIFETKDWDKRHSLDERELFVVADGERLKLGRMALVTLGQDTNKLVDVMKETLEVSLSYQNFTRIAAAEEVEMKVGKTSFALQEKNIAALRDLNNRVMFKER